MGIGLLYGVNKSNTDFHKYKYKHEDKCCYQQRLNKQLDAILGANKAKRWVIEGYYKQQAHFESIRRGDQREIQGCRNTNTNTN